MTNLLLLFGGGSSEHEISRITCSYIESQIDKSLFNIFKVEIAEDAKWIYEGHDVSISFDHLLRSSAQEIAKIDLVLPCIHGYPAETGDLQSFLKIINLPFFGVEAEASKICFNKVLTKLWFEKSALPTAPFLFLESLVEENVFKVTNFLNDHKHIFIKASNQGSSIGCFSVKSKEGVRSSLEKAFRYSSYVLVEAFVEARELEVSVFEYKKKLYTTPPGEIICPSESEFYDYEQKYAKDSKTQIHIVASNISKEQQDQMQNLAKKVFKNLKLKDLSRVDFFLTKDGEVLLNEINTFPGMTPISLFPQMLEKSGVKFSNYINERLSNIKI